MTRPSDPGFDIRISDWLEADPNLAPPDLLRTVESALPSIPQRRVLRLPWRFPPMSTFTKVAVAAVAVIAIGVVGMFALQPRGVPAVGTDPTASPTPSPSPAASPSATPVPTPPPLSKTFTSPTNDIAIAYPEGWNTAPATQPWTTGWPNFEEPFGNFLYDPMLRDHLFIALASQPLAGKSADQWAAEAMGGEECGGTRPVTIDGASGVAGVACNVAAVALDGRGYLVTLYTSGDDAWLETAYDRAWFEQLLATVDLQPAGTAGASAPGAAVASIPPSMSATFTSPGNGISIAYPEGWKTRPATQPWITGWPQFDDPSGDFLSDPVLDDHLFIVLASQPLAGKDGAQWAAGTLAVVDDCGGGTEPVTIDGASGLVGVDCNGAAVAVDGRGYFILLYTSGDDAWLDDAYDRAWFEQLLTTIDLRPEDAASASPSPSP